MTKNLKCPICGKINEEQYETMEIWGTQTICEDYYGCSNCGYWSGMAYSDNFNGIDLHSVKQILPLIKNYKKIKKYKVKISKCPF